MQQKEKKILFILNYIEFYEEEPIVCTGNIKLRNSCYYEQNY